MKYLLSIAAFFCTISFSHAQQNRLDVEYYNADWKKVKTKDNAAYYRESYISNDTLFVSDYFINGTKQMIGQYADKKGKVKVGLFSYYNEKGIKTSEGNYLNNKAEGEWVFWNNDGIKDASGKYSKDKREGEWLIYNNEGIMKQKWFYRNENIVNVIEYNRYGLELSENDTFTMCDQMPQFDDTPDGIFKFLAKNIEYPAYARENNIQGRVVIEMLVDKTGQLSNFKVLKSVDPSLEKEALRVLQSSSPWIPGKNKGSYVCVRFVMPIVFKLSK